MASKDKKKKYWGIPHSLSPSLLTQNQRKNSKSRLTELAARALEASGAEAELRGALDAIPSVETNPGTAGSCKEGERE